MSLESFTNYWMSHDEQIIGVLLVGSIFLIALLLYRYAWKPANLAMEGVPLGDLEATLKDLINRASNSPNNGDVVSDKAEGSEAETGALRTSGLEETSVGVGDSVVPGGEEAGKSAGGGESAQAAESARLSAEVETKIVELQTVLREKETIIEKLQGDGRSGGDPKELDRLKKKLKELEDRLREYEIIEDDIADLSLFKEENERLKDQVAELKTKAGGSEDVSPGVSEAVVQDRAQIPAEEEVGEAAKATDVAAESDVTAEADVVAGADIAADSNVAVEADVAAELEELPGEPDIAAAMAETPSMEITEEPKAPASEPEAAEDSEKSFLEEDLDTDRMLKEMADLSPKESDSTGDPLEENVDTDKMVSEMMDLDAKDENKDATSEIETDVEDLKKGDG